MRLLIRILSGVIGLVLVAVFILNTFMIPNQYSDCDVNHYQRCINDTTAADCDMEKFKKVCPAVDAIVVISGGDTKARTEYGVKLYKMGIANTMILSGAAFHSDVPSNAEEMAKIAIDLGVSRSDVLIETQSRNTYQNAEFVKDALKRFGYKSFALVTSGYHQRRAEVEFRKFLEKDIKLYNAPVPSDKDWSAVWFLTPRGWYLAIKESAGLLLASTGQSQ